MPKDKKDENKKTYWVVGEEPPTPDQVVAALKSNKIKVGADVEFDHRDRDVSLFLLEENARTTCSLKLDQFELSPADASLGVYKVELRVNARPSFANKGRKLEPFGRRPKEAEEPEQAETTEE